MIQPATAQPLPIAPPRPTVFDTGAEQCPQGQLPGPAELTPEEAKNGLDPLQFVPVFGMIYRAITGAPVSPPFVIAGSVVSAAAFGGPLGVLGSVLLNTAMELARLGPDTSRPPVPEGMDATGSEAGIRPVSPGSITTPGGYTTLATILPDFLGGGLPENTALAQGGTPARQVIAAYEAGTMTGAG